MEKNQPRLIQPLFIAMWKLLGVPNIRSSCSIAARPTCRVLYAAPKRNFINPLLPFDVLEELENDEVEDKNKSLEKDKKKLTRQKKRLAKKLHEEIVDHTEGKKLDEMDFSHPATAEVKQVGIDTAAMGTLPSTSETSKVPGHSTATRSTDGKPNEMNASSDSKSQGNTTATVAASAGGSLGNGGGSGGGGGGPPKGPNEDPSKEEEQKKALEEEEAMEEEEPEEPPHSSFRQFMERFGRFVFKCLETMGITLSSVGVLGLSGFLYHKFYNQHVLEKIDSAFEHGDPAYQLAIHKKTNKRSEEQGEDLDDESEDLSPFWVTRPQQLLLDDIVGGKIRGRYFLVVGEKGTGKTTLIMEAMKKINGHNVAIFDAHADPEIFRIRLGKALNFAFNEDYIGSLFSIRGPRDTTALLDIERAFNKLEELAIKRRMLGKSDRPLVLIVNNSHLIKDNEEGIKLLELLQQKAEGMSGSELVTMIFNSDDYWVYEKLKKLGTRLELINVRDFNRKETVSVLQFMRNKYFPSGKYPEYQLDEHVSHQIYDLIGGRPQHISQVARHRDVFRACHEIIDREKTWFLNQCGLLGEEMDDDVMESGKFSTSAMLLMREFVEMDRKHMNTLISKALPDSKDVHKEHHLPELPLWRSRQIMTRPDYIQQYDNLNIFTVDSDLRVRADSVPMMRAFHEIASQPQFDELLDETVQRVGDIESLGRTREIVMKDLALGSNYEVHSGDNKAVVTMHTKAAKDDDGSGQILLEEISKSDHRKRWWNKRMGRFDQSYMPEADVPTAT